jgi:ABC-2 type transport system ATP-binding protein
MGLFLKASFGFAMSLGFSSRQTLPLYVTLNIQPGNIVGLIGPNGAGKTTLLSAILGLHNYAGELSVMGHHPIKQRQKMMQDLFFVADVSLLPQWLQVQQLLEFSQRVHPRFNYDKALQLLGKTKIKLSNKIKALSKGMQAQLHLILSLSIDARLLILDEPTLGLDILHRKNYFESLMNDYFTPEKTIVITTHQVEEVEEILTHLIFIDQGKITLDYPIEEYKQRFFELEIPEDRLADADNYSPILKRKILGRNIYMYEDQPRENLEQFGQIHTPSIADVFVARFRNSM